MRHGDHLVGLGDGHRQRLLADHVLAGPEGRHRLRVVQERRRGDVDEIDVVARQHRADVLDVGDAEPLRRGMRGRPVRAGHARERHPRHLGELLEGVEPEAAAPDHPQTDFTVVHQRSFRQGRGVSHSLVITPIFPGFRVGVNSGRIPGYTGACLDRWASRLTRRRETIMSQAVTRSKRLRLGPRAAGMLLTPEEFDRADFKEGWRYELINEVLVVSPSPFRNERDPNEELGHSLRNYQESHPQGAALDLTLAEETIETKKNRRRADRVIWAGLGRLPGLHEPPTIVIEFVSKGRINRERDYVAKRAEYREIGVKEYWIIDRFAKTMTVCIFAEAGDQELVIPAGQTYATGLLAGFRASPRQADRPGEPLGQEAEVSWVLPHWPARRRQDL